MDENSPASAWDSGSVPVLGRFYLLCGAAQPVRHTAEARMPWSHAPEERRRRCGEEPPLCHWREPACSHEDTAQPRRKEWAGGPLSEFHGGSLLTACWEDEGVFL